MKHNANVSYLVRQVISEPRPELDAERAQVVRAREGDREAINSLISANLPGVIRIAKSCRCPGMPIEDLIAEGYVGLLRAIHHYSEAHGTRFMTYASFWVRKEMLAAVAGQSGVIRATDYARRQGRDCIRVLRLDAPKPPGAHFGLAEKLRHPGPLPAETVIAAERVDELVRLVERLSSRERAVIIWHHGLGGRPPETFNDIACRLGVSRERVRQIEVSALAHMREAIATGTSRRAWRQDARGLRSAAPSVQAGL